MFFLCVALEDLIQGVVAAHGAMQKCQVMVVVVESLKGPRVGAN